jgi:Domain of unknown function (DUF397)
VTILWKKPCGSESSCAEVALVGKRVRLRNSNDRGGPSVEFSPAEWAEFLTATETNYKPYNTDVAPDGSVLVHAPKGRGGPPVYLSDHEWWTFKYAVFAGEFNLDRVTA